MYAEVAISELLKRRDLGDLEQPIPELLSGYSLMDRRGQRLSFALTGNHIHQAPLWANYKRHVERRNAIVPGGAEPTDEEAATSIGAAEAFFAYVQIAGQRRVADHSAAAVRWRD